MQLLTVWIQGLSWTAPELINVTNTWGPHYAGNDVAHGIEMVAAGPHKGRLVIARRYDGTKDVADYFSRSYVLYSDDHGKIFLRFLSIRWICK